MEEGGRFWYELVLMLLQQGQGEDYSNSRLISLVPNLCEMAVIRPWYAFYLPSPHHLLLTSWYMTDNDLVPRGSSGVFFLTSIFHCFL